MPSSSDPQLRLGLMACDRPGRRTRHGRGGWSDRPRRVPRRVRLQPSRAGRSRARRSGSNSKRERTRAPPRAGTRNSEQSETAHSCNTGPEGRRTVLRPPGTILRLGKPSEFLTGEGSAPKADRNWLAWGTGQSRWDFAPWRDVKHSPSHGWQHRYEFRLPLRTPPAGLTSSSGRSFDPGGNQCPRARPRLSSPVPQVGSAARLLSHSARPAIGPLGSTAHPQRE